MLIIKFFKDNCDVSDAIEPILTKVCKEYNIDIRYKNTTSTCKLSEELKVKNIPTIMLMVNDENFDDLKHYKEVKRHDGIITEQEMIQFVTNI